MIEIDVADFIYAGDGSGNTFTTPYFLFDTDIVATIRPASSAPFQLILSDHYSLSGAGDPQGGLLTITDPSMVPGPQLGSLVIESSVPPTQLRSYPRSGSIDNREYERSVDKLTLLVQRLFARSAHAIHAPDVDLAGPMFLPLEYLRANGLLGFDSAGLPLVYSPQALADLLRPLITGDLTTKTTMKSREELGLRGDSGTDDSVQLVKMMRADSANGGATYFLQPQPGCTFLFIHGVSIPSNINLIFSGLGVTLGETANLRLEGDVAQDNGDAPYRLTADVPLGATTIAIDTGPQGGGSVSSHFPVGTRIRVNGFRDAADNCQSAEYQVIAVTSLAVTLDRPTEFAFQAAYPADDYEANWGQPNLTEIRKVVMALLSAAPPIGQNWIAVDPVNASRFQAGDWVIVEDDKRCSDEVVGATSTRRIHVELFQIVSTGADGANTLRLNRRLEHSFELGYRARVVLLEPCVGSSISGCSAAYRSAATIPDYGTFEIDRAVDCVISDCTVPNEDAFGSVGPMFQAWQSADCEIVAPVGRNPKSVTSGTGRGVHLLESTGCTVVEPDLSGCRLNVLFTAATQCHVASAKLSNDRFVSVQFAGCGEVGCSVSLKTLTGAGNLAPDVSVRRAIRFGQPDTLVGPYRCLVEDGKVQQYRGTGTAVVEFCAGSEECRVTSEMDDVEQALWGEDSTLAAGRLSKKNAVEATVNGYSGRLVDVDGQRNGSATRTIQDLRLALRAYDGSKQLVLRNLDGCRVTECDLDKVTVDPSEPWAVLAFNIARLTILRSDFTGVRGGISLENCPNAYVIDCFFMDFSGGTDVLRDNGGNDNLRWRQNESLGFNGTVNTPGTPSPGLETLVPVLIS